MINMQDLINVRESYSKKMLEDADLHEDRKMGLLMMLGGNAGIINANLE